MGDAFPEQPPKPGATDIVEARDCARRAVFRFRDRYTGRPSSLSLERAMGIAAHRMLAGVLMDDREGAQRWLARYLNRKQVAYTSGYPNAGLLMDMGIKIAEQVYAQLRKNIVDFDGKRVFIEPRIELDDIIGVPDVLFKGEANTLAIFELKTGSPKNALLQMGVYQDMLQRIAGGETPVEAPPEIAEIKSADLGVSMLLGLVEWPRRGWDKLADDAVYIVAVDARLAAGAFAGRATPPFTSASPVSSIPANTQSRSCSHSGCPIYGTAQCPDTFYSSTK